MRYVSIDIETTGLDPDKHCVIELAAVIEDTDDEIPIESLPTFQMFVHHETLVCDPDTVLLHGDLWKIMKESETYSPSLVLIEFRQWLMDNDFPQDGQGKIHFIAAGKNFGVFDWQFLRRLPSSDDIKPSHRALDPTMLFIRKTDSRPPDLLKCARRAGLGIEAIKHRALDDAKLVVQCIRRGWKQ